MSTSATSTVEEREVIAMKRFIKRLKNLFRKKKQSYDPLPERQVYLIRNDKSWYRKTFERPRKVVRK